MLKGVFASFAASLVLLIMGANTPWIGVLFFLACPQPALRQSFSSGFLAGSAVAISTTLAYGLSLAWAPAFSYFFLLGVSAVIHGTLLKRRWRTDSALLVPAAVLVAGATTVAFFSPLGGQIVGALESDLTRALEASWNLQGGFLYGADPSFKDRIPTVAGHLIKVLPALLFVALGVLGFLHILLLRSRWGSFTLSDYPREDLKNWKTPEHLVWLLIASGYALLIPVSLIRVVAMNFLIVSITLYFFQGLAVLSHFFHRKAVPPVFRFLGYGIIVLEQILTLMVAGIGLFDLWGDFRGLNRMHTDTDREKQ
jgi:hypothetical protein